MGNKPLQISTSAKDNKKSAKPLVPSTTSEKDIKNYFNTDFPIVVSPQIFDIREEITLITQIRRYFHANPELKFTEKNTASNIEAYLKHLGIETQTEVAQTSVVGLLKGDHDGPCIMLHAEMQYTAMNALPIEEVKTPENEHFISRSKGTMHACGHDAHLAILCGTAKILSSLKHLLHGSVKFVFQPGECAQKIVEAGVLNEPFVDQVYGLHVCPQIHTSKW